MHSQRQISGKRVLLSAAKPSRARSLPVAAALAVLWVVLRAVVFRDFLFPLTYVLPLLVCVWSRDRLVLWGMAAVFAAVHTVTQPWVVDAFISPGRVEWATYIATMVNIGVAATVVHAIIALRDRLDRTLAEVRARSDALRAQGDELAAQNEELAVQSEELAQQNQDTVRQSAEIRRLNLELLSQAEALREADRRKNEFLATLSHELRNPLAPIRYALRVLDRPAEPGHPAPREVIERQVRHLARLVDDLLDATRISSNKIPLRRVRVDLVPLVRDAISGAMAEFREASQAVDVSLPPSAVWIDADPDRLTQVLTNLLNNATRYTPAGGRITVSAAIDREQAVVTVADTGVGLEAADLSRVFDMFTQVGGPGAGGLGLGLALVRRVVELHGGSVEAHSDGLGRGAAFRVRLPIAAAPATTAADPPRAQAEQRVSRRVLVVDDNVDAADMIATLLTMQGHTVRIARDGPQAIAVAAEFGPEVALLDIGLPGLSGYDVAKRLRADARTRAARLIAVTGWGQEADQQVARESGFDAHVTKPADPDLIVRLVAGAPALVDRVEPA